MNLIKSTYELPKIMANRLRFWLAMDVWGIDEATQIIIGIDPDKTIKPSANKEIGFSSSLGSITLFNGRSLPDPPERVLKIVVGEISDSLEFVDDENLDDLSYDVEHERCKMDSIALEAYFRDCRNIALLFNNPSTIPTSPTEWIERALSKKIIIPWLKTAIERDLLPNDMAKKLGCMKQSYATPDKLYEPSNVKREAGKLNTQAMYKSWQKAYRDLEKIHKNKHKSDVWYSKQIARMEIAKGRNADTIRGHMKL
jgi:hypothetical protein